MEDNTPISKDLTKLYICEAHLMNSIKRLAAKHNASKDLRIMCLCFMAKTIAAQKIDACFNIWKEFCVVLHSTYKIPGVAILHTNIKEASRRILQDLKTISMKLNKQTFYILLLSDEDDQDEVVN